MQENRGKDRKTEKFLKRLAQARKTKAPSGPVRSVPGPYPFSDPAVICMNDLFATR